MTDNCINIVETNNLWVGRLLDTALAKCGILPKDFDYRLIVIKSVDETPTNITVEFTLYYREYSLKADKKIVASEYDTKMYYVIDWVIMRKDGKKPNGSGTDKIPFVQTVYDSGEENKTITAVVQHASFSFPIISKDDYLIHINHKILIKKKKPTDHMFLVVDGKNDTKYYYIRVKRKDEDGRVDYWLFDSDEKQDKGLLIGTTTLFVEN